MIPLNTGYNEDCLELLKRIPNNSLHIICIDPPYLYLKGQKLERPFDERLFFTECKRVLKKDGFIICFGRGTSFYRWNTIMDELGLTFKEEIIWDKSYSTSPLMKMSRVHETISIHTKGCGKINKVKIPYLEMKHHDIDGIVTDIKRLKTAFNNTEHLEAVKRYLEENYITSNETEDATSTISSQITIANRCVVTMQSVKSGMREKSIIRSDFHDSESFTKHKATISRGQKDGNRVVKTFNTIAGGMLEKDIIKERRDHYDTIHPTQKPVRLLERLIALVKPDIPNNEIIAADFFAGSFSFAEACINMGINWICCEIDKEYFNNGNIRINNLK